MELTIEKLTKRYGDKDAVKSVSLNLTPGVWGLIGANGAGKTTLMRMLTGILSPTSGRILYDGAEISVLGERYWDRLGYLPQTFGFYPEFTVTDYLEYISALKGLTRHQAKRRISMLLELLALDDVRKKHIRKLSGGTQRRIGVAQAVLNDPDILILDEPTSGLDPGERARFRNLLSEMAQNKIVFISTHIVSDVESVATQNAVMKNGKIIGIGTTELLLEEIQGKVFYAVIPADALQTYERSICIVGIKSEGDSMMRVRYVADRGQIPDSCSSDPCLEDLYIYLFHEKGGSHDAEA